MRSAPLYTSRTALKTLWRYGARCAIVLSSVAGHLCIWTIRLYQLTLSPVLGANCRYYPSCSAYAIEAVQVHGPLRGGWLALGRLVRCHPWSQGGADPVPAAVHSSSSMQEHPVHHGN